MNRSLRHRLAVVCQCVGLCAALMVTGCGSSPPQLMATPNIYARGQADPFTDVPPAFQNNHVEVLYVTDRGYEKDSTPEAPKYDHTRSRSVVFGTADVQFGE